MLFIHKKGIVCGTICENYTQRGRLTSEEIKSHETIGS
jgi:hypothetical protein